MDEDSLKVLPAQKVSVEEIGRRFRCNPSTVAYWMTKYGLEAPDREKYAARGGDRAGATRTVGRRGEIDCRDRG